MLFSSDVGIDLGNSKFSICAKGQGIVASEAAFIAYRGEKPEPKNIVAFGNEALEMYERSPQSIKVMTPMRNGIVVDCGMSGMILRHLFHKAGIKRSWSKPKILVAALFGATEVERKAFVDVAEMVCGKATAIVNEPLAAANALAIDISGPCANMVVDIGDGATEALVLSLGQSVLGNSMRFGGSHIDSLLVDHVRRTQGLIISRSQARQIKELISKDAPEAAANISIKGTAVNGQLPAERIATIGDFKPVIDHVADTISEFVLNTINRVPPEVSVDLIENGIYLCGGASQFASVRDQIAVKTNLEIKTVDQPTNTVAKGLERMLQYSRI
jgi:rod shape-determining protein MreB